MTGASGAEQAGWRRPEHVERGDHAGREPGPRPRAERGVRLARIAGVEIVADWSLFVIFVLVAVNLGWGILPAWHPGWSQMLVWTVALAAAISFFASIVVHELSHALVARATGIPVHRITLFLFGGMAHLTREPASPKAELLTAAVGPLVSLLIGIGATVLGAVLAADTMALMPTDPERAYAQLGPLATVLLWLGPVNVLLAVFNLIPGFPLDGGRVLRALLWWSTGDLRRATRWASLAGRLVGLGLITWGLLTMFEGSILGGVWLALIGWFLYGAAASGYQQVVVRDALSSVLVERVMRSRVESVPPDMRVDHLVDDLLMESDQQAFPVVRDREVVGIVTAKDVRRVPRSEWPSTTVGAIMTQRDRLIAIEPSAPASRALEQLATHDVDQLPVIEGGVLVGVVRRRDILKWIALTEPGLPG